MKVTRIVFFGAGYVAGAKAGRERYQQIVAAVRRTAQGMDKSGGRDGGAVDRSMGLVDASVDDSGRQ